MFENIGGKIKGLAIAICIIGIMASIIAGFVQSQTGSLLGFVVGMGIAIVGSLISWIGSFFAYGFGELIEKTTEIAEMMEKTDAEKTKAE